MPVAAPMLPVGASSLPPFVSPPAPGPFGPPMPPMQAMPPMSPMPPASPMPPSAYTPPSGYDMIAAASYDKMVRRIIWIAVVIALIAGIAIATR